MFSKKLFYKQFFFSDSTVIHQFKSQKVNNKIKVKQNKKNLYIVKVNDNIKNGESVED